MNCFAHGFRFLDRPYFLVGTALPDWLTMIDRKVRVRKKNAREFLELEIEDDRQHEVASGIVQHHEDDHWFHDHRPFVQLNLELAVDLRERLGADAGFRPHFVAHVVIEMLLDAALVTPDRSQLDKYYEQIKTVDPQVIQDTVNAIAVKPTEKLVPFIDVFLREGYLYDYFEDAGVMYRINRILKRIGLSELPESCIEWVAHTRSRVNQEFNELLSPILSPSS